MKAYIVKIILEKSNPLIWRRVIMPAGANFTRLHDVIQNVSNFQSGYPSEASDLFKFNLPEENAVVTNDEEGQKSLQAKVYKPTGLKIDEYLEKQGEIYYLYDFGEGWQFRVILEKVVEDYYFGYPRLLDGAETAPPEEIGGMDGFYEFLEIYRNPDHSEYEGAHTLAEMQHFKEYDPEWINMRLKGIKYKKTEQDKIGYNIYW